MRVDSVIAIGADHHGVVLKKWLQESFLFSQPLKWLDCGTHGFERVDYPIFARKVCDTLIGHRAERGILICGTGIGMAMVANRFKGIYAGLVWNAEVARRARAEDNVNLLVLPADYLDQQEAQQIVEAWLCTPFNGGRYAQRISLIDDK